MKGIKPLRTRSNTMAKDGTIQRIICGQNGITQPFLNACTDVLSKHELLRVKLGEGAGMSRKQVGILSPIHVSTHLPVDLLNSFSATLHASRPRGRWSNTWTPSSFTKSASRSRCSARRACRDLQTARPRQQHLYRTCRGSTRSWTRPPRRPVCPGSARASSQPRGLLHPRQRLSNSQRARQSSLSCDPGRL